MITDFRMPLKLCSGCIHWMRQFSWVENSLDVYPIVEAPCKHPSQSKGPFNSGLSNYDNGWRRASDSCANWKAGSE